MRSSAARAAHLVAVLTTATRSEARTTETAGLIRIEVDIPEDLSETAHAMILSALSTAEQFGYERVGGHAHVWVALSKPRTRGNRRARNPP